MPATGESPEQGSRVGYRLGWVAVVLLAILVFVEMIVLSVMAAFIALPLAAVPVVVVIAVSALIVRGARRVSRS